MSFKPKGGRSKKAPYQTTVIRVPVELVPIIEAQLESYRAQQITGTDGDIYEEAKQRVLNDEVVTRKKKIGVQ